MTLGVRVPRATKRPDPHLWWGVLVRAKAASGYIAFATVEMREKAGGPQAAVAGVPSASSNFANNPIYPPYAFDTDPATAWADHGDGVPVRLMYKFPAKIDIREIAILLGNSGFTGVPTSLAFQSSDDGVNWTTQWDVAAVGAWPYSTQKTFTRP